MQYRLTPLAAALAVAFIVPLTMAGVAQAQTAAAATTDTTAAAATDKALPTVTVNASADASADGLPVPYAGGQVARGGRVGFLGNKDFLDTPVSTSSYTQEFIKDQQAQGVGDILQSDPTVRVTRGYGNFQEMFIIRGMPVNSDDLSYNGLYGILPRQYVAAELFERVEVLRGASAFLNGMAPGSIASNSSGLGGTINLLPKRATNDPITQVTFGWETGGQGYYAVDMGRRLGDEGRLGIRVNAVRREGGTATNQENNELSMASVGLDYRGNNFRLSADFGLQEQRLTDINSSVSLASGVAVPSAPRNSTNFSQPWSYSNERDEFGTLRGEWDLSSTATAWAAYGYRHGIERNSLSGVTVTGTGGAAATYRFDNSRDDVVNTGEIGIRDKLTTGPIKHELGVTASLYDLNKRAAYGTSAYNALATNIYTPTNYASPAITSTAGGDLANPVTTERTQLSSVAIADTLSMFDNRLQVILGVRKQNYKDTGYSYVTGVQSSYYDASATTPMAGITYKLLDNLSAYANYVEGLQGGSTVSSATAVNFGQVLAPYKSKQKEIGLKYDAGKVGLTAAVFTTSVPNVFEDSTTHIVAANGNQRNRGAEFTAFGVPMRGVRLLAGLTILDAKQQSTSGGTYDGKYAVGVARTQANASVDFDVPGVQGLSTNVRAIYTGSEYLDAANTQQLSPWVRYDLGARYVTTLGGKVVTFRGNIENLTNKNYWASSGGAYGTGYMVLGAGRTFVLSAAVDF